MNVGIALLGVTGGFVLAVALSVQERRERALDALLRERGTASTATVTSVVSVGRHAAFRQVTFAVDSGGTFLQTFSFTEIDPLGLIDGARVPVLHMADPSTGSVRGRLARASVPMGPSRVPIAVGVFIAVLGVAAALVV